MCLRASGGSERTPFGSAEYVGSGVATVPGALSAVAGVIWARD